MGVIEPYDTVFDEWRPLLAACDAYASLAGWRFIHADFMRLHAKQQQMQRHNSMLRKTITQ